MASLVASMDFDSWKETALPSKSMPTAYIYFEGIDLQINVKNFAKCSICFFKYKQKIVYCEISMQVYEGIVKTVRQ